MKQRPGRQMVGPSLTIGNGIGSHHIKQKLLEVTISKKYKPSSPIVIMTITLALTVVKFKKHPP